MIQDTPEAMLSERTKMSEVLQRTANNDRKSNIFINQVSAFQVSNIFTTFIST